MDGITALSVLAIASFAVDRFVTGMLFLLSFIPFWSRMFPDPAKPENAERRADYEKRNKLVYGILAAAVGIFVLASWGNVRFLEAMGFKTSPLIDKVITGLLLLGGAERLSGVVKLPGEKKDDKGPAPAPIQVTGSLVLEDRAGARAAKIG
jgi:hypothetical protein